MSLLLMLRGAVGLTAPRGVVSRSRVALSGSPLSSFPLSERASVDVVYGGDAADYGGDLLILPFWETEETCVDVLTATTAGTWDGMMDGALSELAASQEFQGKATTSCVLTVPGKYNTVRKVALVGLGKLGSEDAYSSLGAVQGGTRAMGSRLGSGDLSRVCEVPARARREVPPSRDATRESETRERSSRRRG